MVIFRREGDVEFSDVESIDQRVYGEFSGEKFEFWLTSELRVPVLLAVYPPVHLLHFLPSFL